MNENNENIFLKQKFGYGLCHLKFTWKCKEKSEGFANFDLNQETVKWWQFYLQTKYVFYALVNFYFYLNIL